MEEKAFTGWSRGKDSKEHEGGISKEESFTTHNVDVYVLCTYMGLASTQG